MGWAATAACGLLLGCAILLLEMVQQPIADLDLPAVWAFVAVETPIWSGCGLGWAFLARAAEPRLGLAGLTTAGLLAAVAFSGVLVVIDRHQTLATTPHPVPRDAFAAHAIWTNTFYGGLYLAAYAGWRRSVLSRRALARMRQARDESAALLQESRVESFRHVLQPQTILQAVAALRRLYREDPVKGDALVDGLVGFLRPAVRSLDAATASLPGEIDLARRYLQLRAQTGGGVGEVSLEPGRSVPEVPFPPRLLTPMLEALCLAGGQVGLYSAWIEDVFRLRLVAEGVGSEALPPIMRQRLAALAGEAQVSGGLAETAGRLVWTLNVDRGRADDAAPLAAGVRA